MMSVQHELLWKLTKACNKSPAVLQRTNSDEFRGLAMDRRVVLFDGSLGCVRIDWTKRYR